MSEISAELLIEPDDEPIESLDVLLDRCLPALTGQLWQACCWGDKWDIGDYRFAVVEFCPDENAAIYLQYWSEPHEPVLMEVASGAWGPGTLKYVWHPQRKALADLGFTIGGKAQNFQKHVSITSPEEAEQAARDALALMFDVFAYRGQYPLTSKVEAGSRNRQMAAHNALTPDDFSKLAAGCGFRTAVGEQEGSGPIVTLVRGTSQSAAVLESRIGDGRLYRVAVLHGIVREDSSQAVRRIDRQLDPLMPVNIVENEEGAVTIHASLVFEGGVTTEWITNRLRRWRRLLRRYRRLGSRRGAAESGVARKPSKVLAVH